MHLLQKSDIGEAEEGSGVVGQEWRTCQGDLRICCILVSGLHCDGDGIDGNDGSGAGVAIPPAACGYSSSPSLRLLIRCLAGHRVSGHLIGEAWRRSLSKMLI